MGSPCPTLLSILAIALSLSRVCPLSIPSLTTGTFRGDSRGSSCSSSSTASHAASSSIGTRRRQQPHQHVVAMAATAMMSRVREGSPLLVADERAVTLSCSRSRSSRGSRKPHRQLGHARRCLATLAAAADGSGSNRGSSSSTASIAAAAITTTSATTPQAASSSSSSAAEGADIVPSAISSGGSTETFRELFEGRLPDWLLTRLEQLGFAAPTLVQRQALQVILDDEKYDAVLHAQTGSGKTLAFLLPLFALVDPSRSAVQGLVVVPTRELGLQVAGVAKRLAAGTGSGRNNKIQVMSVLEGSSNKRQRAWAWADPPHIVIGNPESLSRLVTTGAVRVNAVSYVVVDEVDACLLSESTRAWLHELLARSLSPTHTNEDGEEDEDEVARLVAVGAGRVTGAAAPIKKRVKDRQTVFASATVPQHNHFIRQCVQKQWTLTEPVHVQVHAKEAMPPSLSHFYVVCPPEQKLAVLRALVRRELGVPAVTAHGADAVAGELGPAGKGIADRPTGDGGAGGDVAGNGAKADTRGLVFALPTKPLESIAASLDKALGGSGGGEGQQEKGRGGGAVAPPMAEFLREELGLNARADTMSLFREGETRLLVSTDMAARGLDVPEITHVFNLDLPVDGEGYVHRGGRAGRLGRPGKIISIVTPKQEFVIRRLGNGIGVDIKKISLGSSKRRKKPEPSPEEAS